jgi:integration host factor subunit alpha
MTKADIVEKIQASTGMSMKDSREMLETIFSNMKTTLESGNNLKFSGFGNFAVKRKNDRKGRNPKTGEEITIASRRFLTYKPSMLLKQSINSKSS